MAQTYEQGFKEGVEAAGRKILEELPLSGITDPVDVLNAIPRFLRKKLLTKKVTKWVAVYNQNPGRSLSLLTSHIFDTRAEAERDSGCVPGSHNPVEIEVPL